MNFVQTRCLRISIVLYVFLRISRKTTFDKDASKNVALDSQCVNFFLPESLCTISLCYFLQLFPFTSKLPAAQCNVSLRYHITERQIFNDPSFLQRKKKKGIACAAFTYGGKLNFIVKCDSEGINDDAGMAIDDSNLFMIPRKSSSPMLPLVHGIVPRV